MTLTVRSYQHDLGARTTELHTFITLLRGVFDLPYPLADRRPFVHDRQLLFEAQESADLDPELWLVADVREQYLLLPPSEEFVRRVTWEHDVATGWRPHDDPASPVRMSPDVRFGKPAIGGISTEVVWEHSEAGEDDDEIAETFGLSCSGVRWALTYESSTRAIDL
ncbi:MAG: DUF433 domain-containing protein [Actinomycetota bacterium]|nr:DUF433 domain-containing protein [Actinomycetota bacterium]